MTYTSCITIGGRPILPPVMSAQRKLEMLHYKELAISKEKQVFERKRERHKRAHTPPDNKKAMPSPKKFTPSSSKSSCSLNHGISSIHSVTSRNSIESSLVPAFTKSTSSGGRQDNVSTTDPVLTDNSVNNIATAFSRHVTIEDCTNPDIRLSTKEGLLNVVEKSSYFPDMFVNQKNSFSCANYNVSPVRLSVEELFASAAIRSCQRALPMQNDLLMTGIPSNSTSMTGSPNNSDLAFVQDVETFFDDNQLESPGAIIVEGNALCVLPLHERTGTFSPSVITTFANAAPADIEASLATRTAVEQISSRDQVDNWYPGTKDVCVTPSKTLFTDASTPPSLASTDLAKYVEISPEASSAPKSCSGTSVTVSNSAEETDFRSEFYSVAHPEGTDSNSISSTVRAASECNTEIACFAKPSISNTLKSSSKRSAEEEDVNGVQHPQHQKLKIDQGESRRHVRRSSYTLACPSPALIAHVQLCEEHGITISDDMSSVRRLSLTSVQDAEKSCCYGYFDCDELARLPTADTSTVKQNKQQHLQSYLQNLSCYSSDGNAKRSASSEMCVDELFYDGNTSTHSPRKSVDTLLKEQDKYYTKLRLRLQEEHRKQMDLLLTEQENELSYFRTAESVVHDNNNDSMPDENPSILPTCVSPTQPECLPQTIEEPEVMPRMINVSSRYHQLPAKHTSVVEPEAINLNLDKSYDKVSAAAKGYLTRRLLRSERVQGIIKTIRDTLEFAMYFQTETPIKKGRVTPTEANLHKKILVQLTSACYEFHDVFFKLSIPEQMAIIAQDRFLQQERATKRTMGQSFCKRNLSSATRKALERKNKLPTSFLPKARLNSGSGAKTTVRWSLSPKRRRVSLDSAKGGAVPKPSSRAKTVSPPPQRTRCTAAPVKSVSSVSDRTIRNVRRNLNCIYGSDTKINSSGRASRPPVYPAFSLSRN